MLVLKRNPEVPASTPDEDLGSGNDCSGILKGPLRLVWRLNLLEPQEWVPEVLILTREEPCSNSRKSRRFSPPGEMRPVSAEESRG